MEVGGVDLSFTNSALFMALAVVGAAVFLTQSMRGRHLVPDRWQSMAELSYEFIANMIRAQDGPDGRPYFTFIFELFMFILLVNLLGMVQYGYTFTSQVIIPLPRRLRRS